jgi:hypothetical protein
VVQIAPSLVEADAFSQQKPFAAYMNEETVDPGAHPHTNFVPRTRSAWNFDVLLSRLHNHGTRYRVLQTRFGRSGKSQYPLLREMAHRIGDNTQHLG